MHLTNVLYYYFRAPFSERPSESLFIVDTSAETKPAVKQTKRRKLKEIGPLKCYEILKPSSAVPDPLVKRCFIPLLFIDILVTNKDDCLIGIE